MKKRTMLIIISLLLLLLSCGSGGMPAYQSRPAAVLHEGNSEFTVSGGWTADISARQAFIYDNSAGEFLYLKGTEKILYPASTTKLLTILYALTLLEPEELVTPGNELSLVADNSTIAYVKTYHTLTVEMLIEGMLLPSGNDAAYALAAAAGKRLPGGADKDGIGAAALFVEGMNGYAKSLGMVGTSFSSPDGNSGEEHYSTVEDMAILAKAALGCDIIMKYACKASDSVLYHSGHTNSWVNTNKLLDKTSEYYSPYVTGLKTGSIGSGNYSLIASCDVSGKTYIIGLFSEPSQNDRFEDALKIIDELD